jgi:predicted DNA-binding transcriptional regulator AlpA
MEMLDAPKAQKLIESKGLKTKWVVQQMGLARTTGYYMLQDGRLPKDDKMRSTAVRALAEILGVKESDLLIRPRFKKSA